MVASRQIATMWANILSWGKLYHLQHLDRDRPHLRFQSTKMLLKTRIISLEVIDSVRWLFFFVCLEGEADKVPH